ncbi:hypothetical protein OPT61_g5252 [Boeremia exigua]|uniref:Uncharacterized protein n=1 Tax=Boeremia exigua TaxID=749465 RepID=A0ACC2IB24_9PLEO|nr:hypothetical protein OPT61_g5252 [Boeremia exigua]
MFVSVKERARQIANGQFTASTTSTPVASLVDLAPEPKTAAVTAARKTEVGETTEKAAASPTNARLSKTPLSKDPTKKLASPKAVLPSAPSPKAAPPKSAPPPELSSTKKPSAKPRLSKETALKPSSPRIGPSKVAPGSKVVSRVKPSSAPKGTSSMGVTPAGKTTTSRTTLPITKSKRSKSPPKRVDSPFEDNDDPLALLRNACLKQISGVTGLGGRRLAIVLKQRSSGEWYAALKDTSSDKYLKMWMNKDRTYATKEQAMEAYLVFVTKAKNEVRWFPLSPRASSPKGKGK